MKIILVQKGDEWLEAKVDDCHYERLSKFNWKWVNGYARRNVKVIGRTYTGVHMHIEVLKSPDMTDHINNDRLYNRRSNLRACDYYTNGANRRKSKNAKGSKYKGVRRSWSKWRAGIMHRKQPINLGTFDTEIQAAKAYDQAAKKLFGEFAHLNFP